MPACVKVVDPPEPVTVMVALLTATSVPELSYSAVQDPDKMEPSANLALLTVDVMNVSVMETSTWSAVFGARVLVARHQGTDNDAIIKPLNKWNDH